MSTFTLPRFSKTGGKSQKWADARGQGVESPSSRSPSFFGTIKAKFGKTQGIFGSSQGFESRERESPESSEGKSYFSKTSGQGTAGRTFTAFAWGGHSSTLQECAAEGDLDGVKRLLNLGEDVDDIDEEGNTALHYAADGGFDAIVKLLVEKSADLNAANEEGDTAMHKATISNFVGIIELLVAGGANVNAQNMTGWTALHEAACNGRLNVAQTLLHLGADVRSQTAEGDTALHKAARWGRVDIVKLLLLVGSDAKARDKLGREPSQRTNSEEIRELLRAGKRDQAKQAEEGSDRRQTQEQRSTQDRQHTQDRRHSQSSPHCRSPGAEPSRGTIDIGLGLEGNEWNIADQRELYEVQWSLFASNKNPERKISYSDVPWPGVSTSPKDIVQVVVYGTTGPDERRKRLRAELLRWHPDKFQSVFGRNLTPEDADQILAKVKEISQAINMAAK